MLSTLISWSIRQRYLVILLAAVITIWIISVVSQMPVDVFPAFAPPQVEIQTEAPGLAPEEVESLVTLPIESAINGTPGVTTVRSASGIGLSVVKVIFNWNTEIYQARQLVTERLQQAQEKLPNGVNSPQISPITSPISTVVQYALTLTEDQKYTDSITPPVSSDPISTSKMNLMEVRRLVDWQITNRLLAVPGVSQVVVYGGDIRQYQVLVNPSKLKAFDISLQAVTEAAEQANTNAPGGFLTNPDQEFLIRGVGRITSIEDLKESVIISRNGVPIRLKDVAEVRLGAALKRGDGWLNGKPAVVILINKQPQADTPTVTRNIEAAMAEIQAGLPEGIQIDNTFRQEDFIEASIENVRAALIEGSIIVALILIPFLMNGRALVVSLTALPLSLLLGLLGLNFLGQGLNTMTLGGLAVAIGNAVDDAIVDVENVYRCLRENRLSPHPRPALEIVFEGCQEVRDSLFGATLITGVIFSPVFALEGVEGRIFAPMGIAYLVVVLTSGITALTVTPALCAILLPKGKLPQEETAIARFFKRIYGFILKFSMSSAKIILAIAFASLIATIIIVPSLGRIFLPEFQERSLVNTLTLYPGVSLEATNRAGFAMQEALKDDPRFDYIQLRSGRAPGDADAAGVNQAHLDVELSEKGIKDRKGSIEKIREEFAKLPGVAPNIGGFISHRMDEVLSGVRSAIAVKIFGPDLEEL
ncbi:MAG: efflux RND transporter permease subunit, partial [Planktothrix sp.]